VCKDVGLVADPMLLGGDVEKMSDAELAEAAEKTTLFARLSPAHKQRVIRVLRGKGHVVGFMGDGINDAPALRAADIGISVDTATDIAKESADLILLEKDLMVLEGGVIEGRKVFANISSTSGWERVPTSATCSACWERAPSCRSFRWPRFRC
jgi:P-type Mg2+ transporter